MPSPKDCWILVVATDIERVGHRNWQVTVIGGLVSLPVVGAAMEPLRCCGGANRAAILVHWLWGCANTHRQTGGVVAKLDQALSECVCRCLLGGVNVDELQSGR